MPTDPRGHITTTAETRDAAAAAEADAKRRRNAERVAAAARENPVPSSNRSEAFQKAEKEVGEAIGGGAEKIEAMRTKLATDNGHNTSTPDDVPHPQPVGALTDAEVHELDLRLRDANSDDEFCFEKPERTDAEFGRTPGERKRVHPGETDAERDARLGEPAHPSAARPTATTDRPTTPERPTRPR